MQTSINGRKYEHDDLQAYTFPVMEIEREDYAQLYEWVKAALLQLDSVRPVATEAGMMAWNQKIVYNRGIKDYEVIDSSYFEMAEKLMGFLPVRLRAWQNSSGHNVIARMLGQLRPMKSDKERKARNAAKMEARAILESILDKFGGEWEIKAEKAK